MRPLILPLFFLTVNALIAQQTITADEFSKSINQEIRYCDKVYSTYVSSGSKKLILLNLGEKYPHQKITVAIFEENWKKFAYKPEDYLQDKSICVTGKLIEYNNKPELVVSHPKQIEIID